ncbi:MAG TPA: hypothetical protein PK482_07805 [Spirochaetota bacterium]|nr:hypothetical protein [Spirochaetota bacterium]
MENLLWKIKNKTKTLAPTPFSTEEEFEKLVFETPEILEDIFLLKRQIRGSNKSGIPDIIGIDNDGNICIIEMKNVSVNSNIIPQVLEYAFWAERNPDSIKSLWLECDNKPEDLTISWDECEVRILVIAPRILQSTLDLVDKINYSVDLIEIKRWVDEDNQLLLVNKLEPEKDYKKSKPVSGLEIYDEDFYKKERNPNSVKEFMKYTRELDKIIKTNNWQLEMKYNKHYCGYKTGFFNAFGIKWVGTKSFAFFIKITEDETKKFNIPPTKYESHWKEAVYYIEPGKTKVEEYIKILEYSYKKITGL